MPRFVVEARSTQSDALHCRFLNVCYVATHTSAGRLPHWPHKFVCALFPSRGLRSELNLFVVVIMMNVWPSLGKSAMPMGMPAARECFAKRVQLCTHHIKFTSSMVRRCFRTNEVNSAGDRIRSFRAGEACVRCPQMTQYSGIICGRLYPFMDVECVVRFIDYFSFASHFVLLALFSIDVHVSHLFGCRRKVFHFVLSKMNCFAWVLEQEEHFTTAYEMRSK